MTEDLMYKIIIFIIAIMVFVLAVKGIASAQTTATAHVEKNPINTCVQVLTEAGYLPIKN